MSRGHGSSGHVRLTESHVMQRSNRDAIQVALRALIIVWLAVAIAAPTIIFGVARLLHVPASSIWSDVVARPRNLIFAALTVLLAARVWYAARYEGYNPSARRHRRRTK